MRVENVTGPVAHHAETPVWAAAWGGLRFVDGTDGDMLTLRDDGVTRQHIDDEYLAFVRPRVDGGFVAVGARTLYFADEADGPTRSVAHLLDDANLRMNDGCCDPLGRLLAGSMSTDGSRGTASLVRLDTALQPAPVLGEVTESNGVAFTHDDARAYYIDTATQRVDVIDVDDGELGARHPLVTIDDERAVPDGLCVAADGTVWVAINGGSAVHGYDQDGALIERIGLPVPQVSACTFGGDGLRTLFITTSAQGLPPDHGTAAGSVFAVDLGIRGQPVRPFAG